MRGPARIDRELPPGGKALERTRQFEAERGLDGDGGGPALEPPDRAAALTALDGAPRAATRAGPPPPARGWRPLGPFSIPHGQTYAGDAVRPPVAGRVSAVAVDPRNRDHILCGAAGGGIWETKDRGVTWEPRTDSQPSLAIGAIAFDPSDPRTAYAGTGEGNQLFSLGAGVLRSTDGGTTWTVRANAGFVGFGFFDLLVDPLHRNHLLASGLTRRSGALPSIGAVLESKDRGATWTPTRAVPAWDLSMHPPVPGNAHSTDEVFAGFTDGLRRSTDGGTTWNPVALPGSPVSWDRIEVCHAPSNGDVVYVFAAGPPAAGAASRDYVWRRGAAGGAFAAIPAPGLGVGQAWYDWFAAVAPDNPNQLYVAAIDLHRGDRNAAGVWTWTQLSPKPAGVAGDSIHPDLHAIAFDPTDPATVYIGCDGGLYRTGDRGVTFQSLNKGLAITEIEYLAQHPQLDTWLLCGTQDNGTQQYEGHGVWHHVADGDGGDCAIDETAPHTCYHTYFDMSLERSERGGRWETWTDVSPPAPAASVIFYPPVEANGATVAQADQWLFVSRDRGDSWTMVALPLAAGEAASALAIPTPNRIYVGTTSGNVFRVDFSGGAWQAPVPRTSPRAAWLSDLVVDARNPNRIWATSSWPGGGTIFRSDDEGSAWTNVTGTVPGIPVNTIVLDPADGDVAYVGLDLGVFRTADAGANWAAFTHNLPNALVKDLVFHPRARLLRAGTQSRGVWEIAVDEATMPNVAVYLRDNHADSNRVAPSFASVNDPFDGGAMTQWWESPDIKLDASPFQFAATADVDSEVFADDHGVLPTGLRHEDPAPGAASRVYVQVHNRGRLPATNVVVRAFFADSAVGLPDLPANFWTSFPTNAVAAASPWQPVAAHAVVPKLDPGRSHVVAFDWTPPSTLSDHACLLAAVSSTGDAIATAERNVAELVLSTAKCAVNNVAVIERTTRAGRRATLLRANLWDARGPGDYLLTVADRSEPLVEAVVLSTALSAVATAAAVPQVPVDGPRAAELASLVARLPDLAGKLDTTVAYVPPTRGRWLSGLSISTSRPEPIVLLFERNARAGRWSLVQTAEDGRPAGGLTIVSR